jgi:hypothetical protein
LYITNKSVVRLWQNQIRGIAKLECLQIPNRTPQSPLLPPDVVYQSSDISVEGNPRTTRFKTPLQARKEYHKLCMSKLSVHRQRKFVFGALYENIYPGYHEVDPGNGDFDLTVTLPSAIESVLKIRLVSPDDGNDDGHLLKAAVELGRSIGTIPGNARRDVGDKGSMHAIGFRSASKKEQFVCKEEVANRVRILSSLMRHWMEDNVQDVLRDIVEVDKQLGVHKLSP